MYTPAWNGQRLPSVRMKRLAIWSSITSNSVLSSVNAWDQDQNTGTDTRSDKDEDVINPE